MIFLTHAAFGLLLGVLITNAFNTPIPAALFIFTCVFASLLPDVDVGTSFLGKYLRPWNSFLKHRGFFHSILAMVIFSIIAYVFLDHAHYAVAVIIGYASHLFLDSLTPSGLQLFWPSKLSFHGKYRTGGLVDLLLFAGFSAALIVIII